MEVFIFDQEGIVAEALLLERVILREAKQELLNICVGSHVDILANLVGL